jgi:hypothetical protein
MMTPDLPRRHAAVAAALFALALGPGAPAQAGPDRLSVLLGSHHVNAARDFKEVNPGLFLTWEGAAWAGRLDLGAGVFRNSYGDGSAVGSVALPMLAGDAWSVDAFAALAWYPGNGEQFDHAAGDIVPLAGVQARYGNVFMQTLPGGGQGADALVTFGLSFALD